MDNINWKDKIATYLTQLIAFAILAYVMHFVFMFPGTVIIVYAVISLMFQLGLITWIHEKFLD